METGETKHPGKTLDFTASTRKYLEKAGVLTTDDLLMLTKMPMWGSRLLGCQRSGIWEIIQKMAGAGLSDKRRLISTSGLHFSEEEMNAYSSMICSHPASYTGYLTGVSLK